MRESPSRCERVSLRDVTIADLPILFEQQLDPDALQMAAFSARDEDAFMAHWAKILSDTSVVKKAILADDLVAGNVVCFEQDGARLVGYWLGKAFWGKGVATRALSRFLEIVRTRPLHAHVAKHNHGSIRVLEKCGFVVSGQGHGPSGAHGEAVEEFVYTLSGELRD